MSAVIDVVVAVAPIAFTTVVPPDILIASTFVRAVLAAQPSVSHGTAANALAITGLAATLVAVPPPTALSMVITAVIVGVVVGIAMAPAPARTTAISVTAAISTAAMSITTHLVSRPLGWRFLMVPVPLPASTGSGAFVAVAHGNVVPWPTSGGESGGGDEAAAAATTHPIDIISTTTAHASTTMSQIPSPISDAGGTPLVHAGANPALLPIVIPTAPSRSNSIGGRGRPSEGPRRARHFVARSLPPPTVVADRAARYGSDRPSVVASAALASVPPRPGPASLLSPSM